MAYDGITTAAVVKELNDKLKDGRISKISQPEKDELNLTVKTGEGLMQLVLSASPALPLVYLGESRKPAPLTAPPFCMLLRKYIGSGRIISVEQPGLERIIRINLSHYDEMGDLKEKVLLIELMGKHSNIMLLDGDTILDSIRHVSALMSSVREVFPGKTYFMAGSTKKDPLKASFEDFLKEGPAGYRDAAGLLMDSYMGLSPSACSEIVRLSDIDERTDVREDEAARSALYKSFSAFMDKIRKGDFSPCVYYDNGSIKEFSAIDSGMYAEKKSFADISGAVCAFYSGRDREVRIRQRSAELEHVVQTALERCVKKQKLQEKQLKDSEGRDKFRLYGELLRAYFYQIPEGAAEYEALDYNSGGTVKIPLDPQKSPMENAERYFEKYQKQKRTGEALTKQLALTEAEAEHLRSVKLALSLASGEADLKQIRDELTDCGYIKKKSGQKREKTVSKPWHYVTDEGFHLYAGRNNYQNEELSFKLAKGSDWWFHAKKAPGSHVIVKSEGRELTDRVFEQAAALAAWYSDLREQEKAEVDYVMKKELKKPPGSAPGFVIYHSNYSCVVKPGIEGLQEV
ncbi:MAG: NFACT family protein [Lachnospiraceae bacterium]|nr:NFACT family protein [Lachnospiraceae bacterium]